MGRRHVKIHCWKCMHPVLHPCTPVTYRRGQLPHHSQYLLQQSFQTILLSCFFFDSWLKIPERHHGAQYTFSVFVALLS